MSLINKKNFINKGYQPEIDCLRALAVSLVVLFHFEILQFTGGFIGVDIFFVISGYLITRIINEDIKNKKFSLSDFYLKRFRRIFPALFTTIILTLIFGFFLLSPEHIKRLSESALYSSLSISNYFFWKESGYFDFAKHFKPLLHTWSLSVEIQFYLVWPILLIFLNFFFKRLKIILILFFLFSLIISYFYSSRTTGFFYFTGFRVYEFLIGAFVYLFKFEIKKKFTDLTFLFGFLLILYCSIFFSEKTAFPSINALFPCIGALLVLISSNRLVYLKKLFINDYSLTIGRLSYSIYLFHWPILIFYKYFIINPITYLEKILLIIITLIFSILSYKFIETPFRKYKDKKFKISNFAFLISSIFIFLIILIFFRYAQYENFNKFLSNNDAKILKTISEDKKIFVDSEHYAVNKKESELFDNEIFDNNVLIFGDSHALDLYVALKNTEEYDDFKFEYLVNNDLNCFRNKSNRDIIISKFKSFFGLVDYCDLKVLNVYNNTHFIRAKKIIISTRWENFIDFKRLVESINPKKDTEIIFVNRRPKFYHIPTLYLKSPKDINKVANLNKDKNVNYINKMINENFNQRKYKLFDINDLLCPQNQCIVYEQKKLLYLDEDHWSFSGAKFFGKKLYDNNFLNK